MRPRRLLRADPLRIGGFKTGCQGSVGTHDGLVSRPSSGHINKQLIISTLKRTSALAARGFCSSYSTWLARCEPTSISGPRALA